MSIFVDEKTKVVYQGLTGSQGRFYGLRNRDYGTQVVAGTNPKKAGTDVDGMPIFARSADAKEATGATVVVRLHPGAGREGRGAWRRPRRGIELVVVITEGVPAQDEAWFFNKVKRDFPGTRILGPNCPGIISPGQGQHRHHRRRDRQAGRPGRHREPLRHAHLPGALRAQAAGHRRDHLRRHRRRPRAGHQLHRLPGGLRGRPATRRP